jgi:hypothetical protein
MQFLTPKASDMLESRNVVPFYQLPIFSRLANFGTIPGRPSNAIVYDATASSGYFATGGTATLTSNSIQFSVVPDKLIIFVQQIRSRSNIVLKPLSFLTINKVQINWNNSAGLLVDYVCRAALQSKCRIWFKNLTYDEFTGLTVSVAGRWMHLAYSTSQPRGPLPLVGVGAYNQTNQDLNTSQLLGSILVLDFATQIPLQEQYFAPGMYRPI